MCQIVLIISSSVSQTLTGAVRGVCFELHMSYSTEKEQEPFEDL